MSAYRAVVYKAKDGKVFVRGQGDPRWRVTYAPLEGGDAEQWRAAVARAGRQEPRISA